MASYTELIDITVTTGTGLPVWGSDAGLRRHWRARSNAIDQGDEVAHPAQGLPISRRREHTLQRPCRSTSPTSTWTRTRARTSTRPPTLCTSTTPTTRSRSCRSACSSVGLCAGLLLGRCPAAPPPRRPAAPQALSSSASRRRRPCAGSRGAPQHQRHRCAACRRAAMRRRQRPPTLAPALITAPRPALPPAAEVLAALGISPGVERLILLTDNTRKWAARSARPALRAQPAPPPAHQRPTPCAPRTPPTPDPPRRPKRPPQAPHVPARLRL